MQRCFDLGRGGLGAVSPNPTVGAVIVHQGRIIGEGYHKQYGQAHAEVNAIFSVKEEDRPLLESATLYVSLEPCCIFGKTPPCTDMIIQHKIPRVVISFPDYTPGVSGRGVEQLRRAGIEVKTGVLERQGFRFNQPRNTFTRLQRPYIILKFAMTSDGFLAPPQGRPFQITNEITKRLVHKWRSEIDALLVGANTAAMDNPQLTNRLYFGGSPLRVVLDRHLRLPSSLHLFDGQHPTLVVTDKRHQVVAKKNLDFLQLDFDERLLPQLLHALRDQDQAILMVEGGAELLESFLKAGLWDEARVLIGGKVLGKGLPAPIIPAEPFRVFRILDDQLKVYFSRPRF